jgi:ABC-type transport system substrate-binding protein
VPESGVKLTEPRTVNTDLIEDFLGSGAIAQGPIPPNSWAFDKDFKGWGPTANADLAKQKLAEGGQPNGFKFTFDVNNSTRRVQISQLIQEQLRAVEMEMTILILESGPYGDRRPSLEYVSRLATWSGRRHDQQHVLALRDEGCEQLRVVLEPRRGQAVGYNPHQPGPG